MRKYALEFLRRGFVALGIGPIVLAILYLILRRHAGLESLSVDAVVIGIFSISALAFIAGGMNSIYRIERLPLMAAILIHGAVLYVSYLCTYLLNDWLDFGMVPILVFSGIFVFGFFAIWAVIYAVIHKNTQSLNEKLKQKQNAAQIK